MPIHDWTRVPAGLFHHFHQDWTIELARALNRGRLPKGVAALVEQRFGPREAGVLAIEGHASRSESGDGGIATLPPPVAQIVRRTQSGSFSDRANRILIKHHLGRIIAVIEVVPPGNKDSRAALRELVEKTVDFLRSGVHVLVVDTVLVQRVARCDAVGIDLCHGLGSQSARIADRRRNGRHAAAGQGTIRLNLLRTNLLARAKISRRRLTRARSAV